VNLAAAVAAYADSTRAMLDAADGLTPDQLDRHVVGGWSPRQVLHHVADSETQSYLRLRRLLAEPAGSVIQGYDEAAWAQCEALGYRDLPVEPALAVFRAVRAASAGVLARLEPADLERHGQHTESGRYTLGQWLDIYTRHPLEHRDQLLEAVAEGTSTD
jgi:hypothetical protein